MIMRTGYLKKQQLTSHLAFTLPNTSVQEYAKKTTS